MAKIKLGKWEVEEAELKREIAAATRRGKAALKTEPHARAARLDAAARQLIIELPNGCVLTCPTTLLPGLSGASAADLNDFELMPGGFDLHWKRLDVQFTMAGLLHEFFHVQPETVRRGATTKKQADFGTHAKKRKPAVLGRKAA